MYMLFVATIPASERINDPNFEKWQGFSGYATNSIDRRAGVERLGDSVWLLNLHIDPLPLCLLGTAAHQHGIAFRLLPYGDEPRWLPVRKTAPATQDRRQP